jgi:hypothetical protein
VLSNVYLHFTLDLWFEKKFKSQCRGEAYLVRFADDFVKRVYVADRLVLPALTQEDIAAIASGRHQMDAFVRQYIHENLLYRFVVLPDAPTAYVLEAAIKSGGWQHGRPLLNPTKQ